MELNTQTQKQERILQLTSFLKRTKKPKNPRELGMRELAKVELVSLVICVSPKPRSLKGCIRVDEISDLLFAATMRHRRRTANTPDYRQGM